jgi:hypothetical protein
MIPHPEKLFFASELQIDKIIMVKSGSFNAAAPTGGVGDITREATSVFNTGVDDFTFFFGVFSLDDGVTWNDFNANVVEFVSGNPVFQTCDVRGESRPGSFTVRATNWYNFAAGSGTARTVLYKVAIIATDTQGDVEGARSSEILQFSSEYNYQKIAVDDVRTINLAAGARSSFTVNHNLGHVPNMRGFIQDGGLVAPLNTALLDTGNVASLDSYSNIAMNTTDVVWTISNEGNPNPRTATIYTRIYIDA